MTNPGRPGPEGWADTIVAEAGGVMGEALAPGEVVDDYEVTRLLGRGGMGQVYLARDTTLGRRVALKLLHATGLSSPSSLERFVTEARATARFSHPNIVAIYGAGSHRGMPYVALEYVRGESLRERIDERPLSVPEALRVAEQIAGALDNAHRHGVLHCDLKPENVMLARDGRLRVLDFGLAVFLGGYDPDAPSSAELKGEGAPASSAPQAPIGTPTYMAPEQWLGVPLTGGTDVWALGMMLFELCTRTPLIEGDSLADIRKLVLETDLAEVVAEYRELPEDVSKLIAQCLESDAQRRPAPGQLARRLGELLHPKRRELGDASPFRGLLPFTQEHADFFFGRDAQIAAVAERARSFAVLPIVGPSGAGKSSFVQAGLVPRLREAQRWQVLHLRPGADAFRALAQRLLRLDTKSWKSPRPSRPSQADALLRSADSLAASLRDNPGLLAIELAQAAERTASRVLLFVDQLEELYTHESDEPTQVAFIQAICTAADDPEEAVRVVFTLRADYLDRIAEVAEAREVLANVTVLHRPDERELCATMVRPLELVGYRFDDAALPTEIVAAVRDEPACLPLLQFVAQRLWEERDREEQLLTRASYEQMGGVEGALASHANGVLAGLSAAERAIVRQLLLRLVTAERTRRVTSKVELLEALPEDAPRMLARLAEARLVTVSTGTAAESAQVELAHESLIHTWDQLARWIDEGKETLSFVAELSQAAELWDKRGRRGDELWTDEALAEAERTIKRLDVQLPALARDFVRQSTQRKAARRRARRLSIAAVVLASVALAIVFGWQSQRAREARDRAERQRAVAESKRAESLRESARAAFAQEELLEARAKLRLSLEIEDDPGARMLWWQLSHGLEVWQLDIGTSGYRIAPLPDGRRVAVACANGTLQLLDVRTSERKVLREPVPEQVLSVAVSQEGVLVAGLINGSVVRWDLEKEARQTSWSLPGLVRAVAFHPDGNRVAAASSSAGVYVIALDAGTVAPLSSNPSEAFVLAYHPQAKWIARGDARGYVALLDAETGAEKWSQLGGVGAARDIGFSPDGTLVVASGRASVVGVWRVADGSEVLRLAGHGAQVDSASFSPDGRMLVTGSYDYRIQLWDSRTGEPLGAPLMHAAEVGDVRFVGPSQLVSVGYDNRVRVWNVAAALEKRMRMVHATSVYDSAFSPDGAWVASAGGDRQVIVWDVASGDPLATLPHPTSVMGLGFAPDGSLFTASGYEVLRWDVKRRVSTPVGSRHRAELGHLALSRDGTLGASADVAGGVQIWDAASGATLRTLNIERSSVRSVAFDEEGARLAASTDDGMVSVWDVRTGTRMAHWFEAPHADGVAFGEDGSIWAGGHERRVRRYTRFGEAGEIVMDGLGRVYDIEFSQSGAYVAVGSSKREVFVAAAKSPSDARTLHGHTSEVNTVSFNADATRLASGSDDATLRMWDVRTGRPVWRAPALLDGPPRLLSHRGWQELAPGGGAKATPHGLSTQLADVLDAKARFAVETGKGRACVWRDDDTLELWEHTGSAPLSRTASAALQVVALGDGCLVRGSKAVEVLRAGGASELTLPAPASALGSAPVGAMVVAGESALRIDADGNVGETLPIGVGVAAAAELAPDKAHGGAAHVLVRGYVDGSVEIVHAPGSKRVPLQQMPASAPLHIVPGPARTLFVGFADGTVGMWDARDGRLLVHERLHGPVRHLRIMQDSLYAASELGSYLIWDLSVLQRDRCELLREVWREVPVLWDEGTLSVQAPPADHVCKR